MSFRSAVTNRERRKALVYEQEDKAVQLLLLDAKRADKRIVKEWSRI